MNNRSKKLNDWRRIICQKNQRRIIGHKWLLPPALSDWICSWQYLTFSTTTLYSSHWFDHHYLGGSQPAQRLLQVPYPNPSTKPPNKPSTKPPTKSSTKASRKPFTWTSSRLPNTQAAAFWGFFIGIEPSHFLLDSLIAAEVGERWNNNVLWSSTDHPWLQCLITQLFWENKQSC